MGSGTSLGRRSSLGSSSGHGGGEGGRGGKVVVRSSNDSKLHENRTRIVGGGGLLENEGPVVGMVDVVKAPRRFGRDEPAQLDPATIKALRMHLRLRR